MGLLSKTGKTVRRAGERLSASNGIHSRSIRGFNRQVLTKAIEGRSFEERDIGASTFAIDASKLPEAKAMIQDFRRTSSGFLEPRE